MRRTVSATLVVASLAGCARAGSPPVAAPVVPPVVPPASGETRGALGAAGLVDAATTGRGGVRLVPLGPMTGDVELLLGHPDSVGRPFVMRIHELPGSIVPPHSHPVDEHITVVRGTWHFGTGPQFDSTRLQRLETGAYGFVPAGTTMFATSPEAAVVQVHGIGPFHIHWRDGLRLLGEAGSDSVFRFRKGDAVATARGNGRILQGYANGTLIQYEIASDAGGRFMAREAEVRIR